MFGTIMGLIYGLLVFITLLRDGYSLNVSFVVVPFFMIIGVGLDLIAKCIDILGNILKEIKGLIKP